MHSRLAFLLLLSGTVLTLAALPLAGAPGTGCVVGVIDGDASYCQ